MIGRLLDQHSAADPADADGDPGAAVDQIQELLVASGAVDDVEETIDRLVDTCPGRAGIGGFSPRKRPGPWMTSRGSSRGAIARLPQRGCSGACDRSRRAREALRRDARGRTASRSRSRRGEVFGLLGPNGVRQDHGRSRSSRAYRRADTGEVRVLGVDPWREGAALRPRIG